MELVSGDQIGVDATTKAMKILVKDKRNIQNIAILLSATTTMIIKPEPVTALLYLGSVINLTQIIKIFLERKDELHSIHSNYFRNTESYRICKKEYDDFIKEIADLIRKQNLKSSKEVCMYIDELIKQGYLSENGTNKYHRHQFEFEHELPELTGAKVLTGNCVCRHYASLTTDILTELGYEACNVAVRICKKHNPLLFLNLKRKSNHMLVGVYENGEKYLYDPTNHCFGACDQSIDDSNKEKNRIAKVIIPNFPICYLIRRPNSIINFQKDELIYKIHKAKLETISTFEVDKLKERINSIINLNKKDISDFIASNQERIKRTAELFRELMPYSDEPIQNWQIRK